MSERVRIDGLLDAPLAGRCASASPSGVAALPTATAATAGAAEASGMEAQFICIRRLNCSEASRAMHEACSEGWEG
jgi:hypothetical protein